MVVDSFVMVDPPTESTEELSSVAEKRGNVTVKEAVQVPSTKIQVEQILQLERERRRHSEVGATV